MPVSKKPKSGKAQKSKQLPVFLDESDIKALIAAFAEDQHQSDLIEAAQEVMYDAWEASGRRKRIALARKALTVTPLCADAYVLLAYEDTKSPEEALVLFRKGVEAGKRALGPEGFKEYAGEFWGFIETRPYMRARVGLAHTLSELGRHDEAIALYKDMLKLNPNDNQGIRYLLAESLLARDDIEPLKKLLKKYKRDASAHWLYTKTLLAFRDNAPDAHTLATQAWQANNPVPSMLSGERPLAASDSGYLTVGGEDEATAYVEATAATWRSTPGAIEWLKENAGKLRPLKRRGQFY